MTDHKPVIGYFPNLDVLRFVLALFVLIFHVPEISKNAGLSFYNDLPFFQRGTEAVYWFFVMSGFLLSLLANKEVSIGRFSILRFLMRRVFRIWPVYLLVSLFGLLFYYIILPLLHIPFENNADFTTAFLLQFFFLSNVLHAFYDPGGILTITWSVSVEEQFYLFFPFLVYFVYRITILKRVVIASLFLVICSIYFMLPPVGTMMHQLGLYIELFLTGIIAAEFFYAVSKWNASFRNLLLAFSLLLFFMLFFTDMLLLPGNPFLWRMLNGIAAAVMVLALSTVEKKCSIQWLLLGGKISYGIYMYHMIVITGLVFIFQKLPIRGFSMILAINILCMVFTYLLALLSYRLYETKFLKMKKY